MMILKVTTITMSQKGELIFVDLPIRIGSNTLDDYNANWFWENLISYRGANNQEMFVHAAEYFSPDYDDIKQVPTKDSSVLLHLIHPMDGFNSLVKWLVKEHDKVTQVRLTLQTKDRSITIYIQEEKEDAC